LWIWIQKSNVLFIPSYQQTYFYNQLIFKRMNIYIANLNYSATDSDLKQLFSEYGEVTSAKVIIDRETGRSRGFGFVEMSDNEASQRAIDSLNDAEFQGKVLKVNEAKPREDKPRGGGGYGGGGGFNRDRGGYKSDNRGGGGKRW
jgi:RNA recognition motif-containing protein